MLNHLTSAPLMICLFAMGGCFPGWAIAAVGHVIHISVDGLRGDLLQEGVVNQPELYPNFKRFVEAGATTFNARSDYTDTTTLPNHTSMITGRPVLQPAGAPVTTHHGYTEDGVPASTVNLHNAGNPNLSYVASTFDVAHDNGLSTALYSGKSKFVLYDQSYDATTGAVDNTGSDNGRDKIDSFVIHPLADAMFLSDLSVNRFQYSFLHFLHPDGAGHNYGWGTAGWYAFVQFVDSQLGSIMDLIETDPELMNDTAIILTADHGGTGTGHDSVTDPANYTIPVLAWGAGVAAGVDLYTLNTNTRSDPGTARPSYTAVDQPIRNGDTGNLAMGLLGLGPVPGSTINVLQDLRWASPYTADFNGDLSVDGRDLAIWQELMGSSALAHAVPGDADGDRDVDGRDFLVWQRQYGSSLETLQPFLVPETAVSGMLLICPGIHLAACRTFSRRSKSSRLL